MECLGCNFIGCVNLGNRQPNTVGKSIESDDTVGVEKEFELQLGDMIVESAEQAAPSFSQEVWETIYTSVRQNLVPTAIGFSAALVLIILYRNGGETSRAPFNRIAQLEHDLGIGF